MDALVALSMIASPLLDKTKRSPEDGLPLAIRSQLMITASTSALPIHGKVTIISSSASVQNNHLRPLKSQQQGWNSLTKLIYAHKRTLSGWIRTQLRAMEVVRCSSRPTPPMASVVLFSRVVLVVVFGTTSITLALNNRYKVQFSRRISSTNRRNQHRWNSESLVKSSWEANRHDRSERHKLILTT